MRKIITLVMLFLLTAVPALAKDKYAVIVSIAGDVARKSGGAAWTPAKAKDLLSPGDSIQTKKGAKATLFLEGLAIIKVGEDSNITLKNKEASHWVIGIKKGRVWVELQKFLSEGDIELETPFGTAVVKGSVVEGRVDDSKFNVILHEGEADVTSQGQTREMNEGESLDLTKDKITDREYTIDNYSVETLKERIDPQNILEAFRQNPQNFVKSFIVLKKDGLILNIYLVPGDKAREREGKRKLQARFLRQIDTRLCTVIVDGHESSIEGIEQRDRGYLFPQLGYIFFGDIEKNKQVLEGLITDELRSNPFNVREGVLTAFSKKDLKATIKSDKGVEEIILRKNARILPKDRPLELGQKVVLMGRGEQAGIVIIRPRK